MNADRRGDRRKAATAQRILTAASEMFYGEGIRGVGVDAISARAGVTKKTLYEKFGSKDNLVAAYLRARDERWRAWIAKVGDRGGGSAKERLLLTFDALGEWMDRENPRGCGFVNAAVELPDADHPGRAVIAEQKMWMRGYLVGFAEEAGAEDPEDLAERLLILHEGATVAHSLGLSSDAAQKARQIASTVVANLR